MAKIQFKSVRWRNLFSFGNTWTDVQLDRSPSTVVVGKNGSGKSTFFEALHIGLFGQSIRKAKKSQWVCNKNNKGLEIEIDLQKGDDEYRIIRKVKPDEFTILKNGVELLKESTIREQQLMLNRDILGTDKIGWQITTQISKVGIQMFMSLDAAERRKFIDNMLGTSVFTEMSKYHKLKVEALKEELNAANILVTKGQALVEGKKQEIESLIAQHNAEVERWKNATKEKIEKARGRLDDTKAGLERFLSDTAPKSEIQSRLERARKALEDAGDVPKSRFKEIKSIEKELQSLKDSLIEIDTDKVAELREKKKKTTGEADKLRADLTAIARELEKLEAGYCGACRQVVTEEHVEKETALLNHSRDMNSDSLGFAETILSDIEAELERISDTAKKNQETVSKIKEKNQDIAHIKQSSDAERKAHADKLLLLKNNITDAENAIAAFDLQWDKQVEGYRERLKAAEVELAEAESTPKKETAPDKSHIKAAVEQLEKMNADFKEGKKVYNGLAEQAEYFQLVGQMLKDGGVKTVVVRKFLPIINRIVNEKLSALGFFAKFRLDENFEETIVVNGNEMVFSQFSEGEKLRINIALILAWREIARLQGKVDTNLLLLDEVLGESIDHDGYEALTMIFKVMEELNIFIITHSPERVENIIRSKLEFEKVKGFSKIKE